MEDVEGSAAKKGRKEREKVREGEGKRKETCNPITSMNGMHSPFIPVVVVDLVLFSAISTKFLAWKSPKVPLEERATLRLSIPFSGVTTVLKYRMKYTITLPGLKAKFNKAEIINENHRKYLGLSIWLCIKTRTPYGQTW